MTDVALVVGARGVIGGNLAEHLLTTGDWEVIGLSRRGGEDRERLRHVSVDLLDADATREAVSTLTGVTHVFYAAYQDRPSFAELVAPNVAMLANVLDAVEPVAAGLSHVSLMQGYKVYGAHLGPFKTPAREDDPPHLGPEFNVVQQELVERRAARGGWQWSALRPSVVCGVALGIPMNLVNVLAVYATICRESGVPLRFPGAPDAYDSLIEMTDAGLLARATVWAATDPRAADQAFNVNNGDVFRWRHMWPRIAAAFDLEIAEPLPMRLQTVMADKAGAWEEIVRRHDLAPTPYEQVSSWAFGDAVLSWDYDLIADGSKLRRLGFPEQVQTDAMFTGLFDELRRRRIVP